MAEIKLDINTNTGKVKKDLKQVNTSLTKTGKMAKRAKTEMKGMSSALVRAGGAIAGFAGISKISSSLAEAARQSRQFEDSLTGLLSLGNNIDSIVEIRKNVQDLSTTYGIMGDEVARANFNLISSTGNLSDAIRDDLAFGAMRVAKSQGIDLALATNFLATMYNIVGDEVGSVNNLIGKSQVIAEQAKINWQDFANLMPRVANNIKLAGLSFDELGALIVQATQKGGSSEITFTGINNLMLGIVEAQKKGIELSGNLIDKLGQISKLNNEQKLTLVGREGIAVLESVLAVLPEVQRSIGQVARAQDTTQQIISKSLEDSARRTVEALKIQDALNQQVAAQTGGGAARLGGQLSGAFNRTVAAIASGEGDVAGVGFSEAAQGQGTAATLLRALTAPALFYNALRKQSQEEELSLLNQESGLAEISQRQSNALNSPDAKLKAQRRELTARLDQGFEDTPLASARELEGSTRRELESVNKMIMQMQSNQQKSDRNATKAANKGEVSRANGGGAS